MIGMKKEVQTETIPSGDYEMCVHRAGKQNEQKVILLHGSGPGVFSLINWNYVLADCSDELDCIAPDLIGFGNSSHPNPVPKNRNEWMGLWVQQVIDLLDYYKIESANLVGNSLGCQVALELLIEYPERFKKVILMGSGGTPNLTLTPELARAKYFYDNPSLKKMKQIMSWFVYDAESLQQEIDDIAIPRFEVAMREEVQRSNAAIFAGQAVPIPETALHRLQHDVLLVHGRDDRVCPKEASYYFLEHIPKAQMHVFSQTGHWAQIEKRESFHTLMKSFFFSQLSN